MVRSLPSGGFVVRSAQVNLWCQGKFMHDGQLYRQCRRHQVIHLHGCQRPRPRVELRHRCRQPGRGSKIETVRRTPRSSQPLLAKQLGCVLHWGGEEHDRHAGDRPPRPHRTASTKPGGPCCGEEDGHPFLGGASLLPRVSYKSAVRAICRLMCKMLHHGVRGQRIRCHGSEATAPKPRPRLRRLGYQVANHRHKPNHSREGSRM